jgi:ABC-type multidrug transport system ATPase subunit
VSEAVIELREASKSFGPTRALDRVSLRIAAGECFGLIGPNGAGKTTSFSLMCGYLRPSSGQVQVLGVDPFQSGALHGRLGVLPQDAQLPSSFEVGSLLTGWARLSQVASPEAEARDVLARVGLPEVWRTTAGTLSHGMAKRVGLAQALLGTPTVLLLDEPTAGLDPKVAAQVRSLIADLKGKTTVVVSSHNLQELEQLCDAVALLDRGRLTAAGSLSEFTASQGEFHVEIAQGSVPLTEVRALTGVTEALLAPSGKLTVRFNPTVRQPAQAVSETLALLLQKGVWVLSVQRGRKLEDRVLQLTS